MGPENPCIVLLDLVRIQDPQWSLAGPFFQDYVSIKQLWREEVTTPRQRTGLLPFVLKLIDSPSTMFPCHAI